MVNFLLSELFAEQKSNSYYIKEQLEDFKTAIRDDNINSVVINFDNRKIFNEVGMLILYPNHKQVIFITSNISENLHYYNELMHSFLYDFLGIYGFNITIIDIFNILAKLISDQNILSKIYIDPNPKKTKTPSIELNYNFGFYEYNYHSNPNIVNLYHRFSFKNFDISKLRSELSEFINNFIKLIEIPTNEYVPALNRTYRSNLCKRSFNLNLDDVGYLIKLEQFEKNDNTISEEDNTTFIELIKSLMKLKFKKTFSIKIGKTTLSVNDGMIKFSWHPFFKFVKTQYLLMDTEYAVKILKANNQYDLVVNRLKEIIVENL